MKKTISQILLLCLLFHNCTESTSAQTKTDSISKTIYIEDIDNSNISIVNPTDSVSAFTLSINGKLWKNNQQISAEIKKLAGNNNDSLFFYAWKFVCNNTYSFTSLSNENWTTSPVLYLNSIGYGLCGKQAVLLSNIWKYLGYKTRIWGLNGHIVPEVYYKNRWQMLDPGYKIYYLNDSNKIASQHELSEKPQLITKPVKVFKNDAYYFLRYTADFAKMYSTVEDNKIIYEDSIPDLITAFKISLPPHSVFSFPGLYLNENENKNYNRIPYKAFCQITISPGWKGSVNNSLLLAGIDGNGKVSLNNKTYSISSLELNNLLTDQKNFYDTLKIVETTDSVKIIYFINPIATELSKINKLYIDGENINNLQITTKNITDSLSVVQKLRKQFFFYENSRLKLFSESLKSNIACSKNVKINTQEILFSTLSDYYSCIGLGNKAEISSIITKISNSIKRLPENYNFERLFYIINNIPNEILFDDFKNASEDELFSIFSFINKKE